MSIMTKEQAAAWLKACRIVEPDDVVIEVLGGAVYINGKQSAWRTGKWTWTEQQLEEAMKVSNGTQAS